MDTYFESKLKSVLKNTDSLKTPSCFDTVVIGLYIEEKLSKEERKNVEEHIKSCLFCLNQLNEMKELLYYQSKEVPIPHHLMEKLKDLYPKGEKKYSYENVFSSFITKIKEFLSFPIRHWRYSVVSVVSICLTILISLSLLKPEKETLIQPKIDLNSFVNIRALNSRGDILNEAQGVVINSKGIVAANLSLLAGASNVEIRLRDGKTYHIKNIWKDDNKNLAVMKIENENLPTIPIADINQINIGQTAFIIADLINGGNRFKEALVSDFKTYPIRYKEGAIQYIQLVSFTSKINRGALIDKEGRLIGLLITEEKNINIATPVKDIANLVKERKAIPISELKDVRFSAEALNYYMKGILASDAQKWDEAAELLKEAVQLNPNLEGAHIELGYIFYRRHDYELEAKEYKEVLKINPMNTDAIFSLAANLQTRGFYEQAIKEYEKVIKLDPEDAEAYYELGIAYLAQGEKDRAMNVYPKLKTLDPGTAELLKRLIK